MDEKRIIITGAQATGKTTLVKNLTPYLKLPCIEEIPRKVAVFIKDS